MSVRKDLRNISTMLMKAIIEGKDHSKELTDNEYKKLLEAYFIICDISKNDIRNK